ncbi:hypothetical protein LOZ52_003160 [Ophidiomyces ophidiicola]|uniref:Uncharacterized protein n=1 Tax=Ophidiomyces ophidiicola TaxID=1387563 RepID=A0ACB8US03_9EURO|nr:hypothetical protein LOZ62_002133 [Ophidiomyces ophidiicola]KAI1965636.1 hypothetical protein LOZ59_001194 [Ophidiomyces ophidiicola]KAI2005535.1 hypothetical protein LOZ50_003618 [Ophidiomyces ophidiicola]KAI2036525.1 hypothetical protein LOZ47_004194 [Ophidiomyces ophidiicola]KAI2104198.1 hypothetical protein LOZ34_004795 [Ophidiomyces ophidiicola]
MSVAEKRKIVEQDAFDDGARTPLDSPPRKKLRITQQQKQALIENLQLEVTERARKLRAHYALQAQDLRSRIERRVNRIPMALRKKLMGDLLAKYEETSVVDEARPNASTITGIPSPFKKAAIVPKTTGLTQRADKSPRISGKKPVVKAARVLGRKTYVYLMNGISRDILTDCSDEIHSSDKENVVRHNSIEPPLANPKKRGKTGATGGTARVISQHTQGSVLSPKSSNSRTFPQSPLKQSPVKPQAFKPHNASSFKSSIGNSDENSKTRARGAAQKILSPQSSPAVNRPSSAASFRPKNSTTKRPGTALGTTRKPVSRPATRQQRTRAASTSTVASNTSVGTTIIRSTRSGTTTTKKSTTGTGTLTGTRKAAASKNQVAPAKKKLMATTGPNKVSSAEAPQTGRRVLRNRP